MDSGVFHILNFPDEILLEIILHLNPRDRIPLGYACTKFNSLVFNDRRCYRNLDFSEEGYLTSLSDVQQYFRNESMHTHVRRINLANMYCTISEPMLQNIMKATNLVELNIIGIVFDDLLQVSTLLDSLQRLRKLSIFGQDTFTTDQLCSNRVEKSFKRLEHLTVGVSDFLSMHACISLVTKYCNELEELRLLVVHLESPLSEIYDQVRGVPNIRLTEALPPKLKIVAGYNIQPFLRLSEVFGDMLPTNKRWTQFRPAKCAALATLYYEKDLEVTQELSHQIRTVDIPADVPDERRNHRYLVPGYLLANAVSIAAGKQTIDSQYSREYGPVYRNMLKVKDIKLLLRNPRHQISYIHLEHDIGSTRSINLSPFSQLTKLVLCGIIRREQSIAHIPKIEKEPSNLTHPAAAVDFNPVFKNLVENTPHVKDFTLYPNNLGYVNNQWDLTTLHLISGWKKLRTLFLAKIPIMNGEFLIEIGKQCENLEKLRLEHLGPRGNWCYKNDLSRMLAHCHNLKDFSIEQNNLGQVSEVFTNFTRNSRLRRLRIKTIGENNTFNNLVSPVEGLIFACDLILFVCEFECLDTDACDELISTLERLKDELNRPRFEFEVIDWIHNAYDYVPRNHTLEFAHKDLLLPHNIIDALYQLDCCQ